MCGACWGLFKPSDEMAGLPRLVLGSGVAEDDQNYKCHIHKEVGSKGGRGHWQHQNPSAKRLERESLSHCSRKHGCQIESWSDLICQGHSSLDAPSELNPPQRIPSPLFNALLVPQAEG